MGQYIPGSAGERGEMLDALGLHDACELFDSLPERTKLNRPLALPEGLSELELRRKMEALAAKNVVFGTVLRGAGAYRHYIPAQVKNVVAKESFVTAYTPYQAEISQGVLQSIFEYQTMICELTGMDAANASVYDGASAAAEAVAMCTERSRRRALVAGSSHPDTIETIKTYCAGSGIELQIIPLRNGRLDFIALQSELNDSVCCVYVQSPNFFGLFEDCAAISAAVHSAGAKMIAGCNPIALGLYKTPAELGADIAVGDGQPLGMPLSFGGPYLGFMACRSALTRRLPGRIVGETTDSRGERAFVLTLQAREQHIRREKASSNICSNQALCALTAAVYLSVMGPGGLRAAAVQSASGARYFAGKLAEIGFSARFDGEFFHEFVTESPVSAQTALSALEKNGILGGLALPEEQGGGILWCVTELVPRSELDRAAEILREVARCN